MNCFVTLRAIKPLFTVNCSRIAANQTIHAFFAKPCANYCHLVKATRFGDFASSSAKQVVFHSKRVISNTSGPLPSYKTKDHSHIWLMERILAVGLLGIIPFVVNQSPNGIEYIAGVLVAAHLHWGLEAICTDYLRPAVVGNFIPKCIPFIVTIPLLIVLYGIMDSVMAERGITHVIKQFWYLKTTEQLKNDESEQQKNDKST